VGHTWARGENHTCPSGGGPLGPDDAIQGTHEVRGGVDRGGEHRRAVGSVEEEGERGGTPWSSSDELKKNVDGPVFVLAVGIVV
jgi:hypothetical protein